MEYDSMKPQVEINSEETESLTQNRQSTPKREKDTMTEIPSKTTSTQPTQISPISPPMHSELDEPHIEDNLDNLHGISGGDDEYGRGKDSFSQSLSISNDTVGIQKHEDRLFNGHSKAESDTHAIINAMNQNNPLLKTKLHPNDDIIDYQDQPVLNDDHRMPSNDKTVEYSMSMSRHNENDMDNEYRNASRRNKICSPTTCIECCMHRSIFGKLFIMILTWTTVIDYAKDLYVAYHLGSKATSSETWLLFGITLGLLFLSLRLMLYVKVQDDTVTIRKLFILYIPINCSDNHIDRMSDLGVCCFWEFVILLGTPFVPFYLVFLATKKSWSLFCSNVNFENPHLLEYSVIECIFETLPQCGLQAYLYYAHAHDDAGADIERFVFYVAFFVVIIVLIKIPFIVWYNWRIVYKLEFKRRHNGEVLSVKYHPVHDIVATGSRDHTVLINNFVIDMLKAKRVLDHHYDVNCVSFMPLLSDSKFEILEKETNVAVRLTAIGSHMEELPIIRSSSMQSTSNQGHNNPSNLTLNNHNISNTSNTSNTGQSLNTLNTNQSSNKPIIRTKSRKILEFINKDIIAVAGIGVELWNWRSGQLISTFPKKRERNEVGKKKRKRTKEVKEVTFSSNGRRLIWCQGKNIHIWSIKDKNELGKIKGMRSEQLGDIQCIDVSPNDKYIAAGLPSGKIKVFNSFNFDCVRILEGHKGQVNSLKFDKDGKYIVSGSADWTVRVWNVRSGEEIRIFEGHSSDVMCVAVDPTNRYIASGGRDRILHITYLHDQSKRNKKLSRNNNLNQQKINQENQIKLENTMNALNKQPIRIGSSGSESGASDISGASHFSSIPAPKMLSKRASIMVEQMSQIPDYTPYPAERDIRCCDFSPYGEFVAIGCEDHTVNLVELPEFCNNGHNPSVSNTPHNERETEQKEQIEHNNHSGSGSENENENENQNNYNVLDDNHVQLAIIDPETDENRAP